MISFPAPYSARPDSARPAGDLSLWIGAINVVGDVLKREEAASVER